MRKEEIGQKGGRDESKDISASKQGHRVDCCSI